MKSFTWGGNARLPAAAGVMHGLSEDGELCLMILT